MYVCCIETTFYATIFNPSSHFIHFLLNRSSPALHAVRIFRPGLDSYGLDLFWSRLLVYSS